MHRLRIAFAAASVLWLAALPLAAIAASDRAVPPVSAAHAMAFFAYAIGSLICHQRPERSFHLAGVQLPVCARCLGVYAGVALTSLIAVIRVARSRHRSESLISNQVSALDESAPVRSAGKRDVVISEEQGLPMIAGLRCSLARRDEERAVAIGISPTRARRLLLAGAAPTVVTILFEWATGQMPGHWTRALSGVPLGGAAAWIVLLSLHGDPFYRRHGRG